LSKKNTWLCDSLLQCLFYIYISEKSFFFKCIKLYRTMNSQDIKTVSSHGVILYIYIYIYIY
jgi:hypothetical protein